MHEQLPASALREVLHRGRLAGARLAHEQDRLLHAHAGRDTFHQRERLPRVRKAAAVARAADAMARHNG